MGADFKQFHDFFGDMYEELFESIDDIAEAIRTLGELAPGSFQEFNNLSIIDDNSLAAESTDPISMIVDLIEDHEALIATLKDTFRSSEDSMNFDISDMIAERISAHSKHVWMMKAITNKKG
jgi:starvation-inducible DNA-binding protein